MACIPVFLLLCVVVGLPMSQCVGEDGDLADRLARLETLLAAQDHRLNTVERENQQLKLSNMELKADNGRLKIDVASVKTENKELKADVTKLRAENQGLKADDAQLKVENQERRDGLTTLNQKVAYLQAAPPKSSQTEPGGQKDKVRDVVERSDDPNALEAVVAQLGQQVTAVEADVQVLQNSVQQARTSVYTRWGHSACPASNQLVYSGVVGGSPHDRTGSAVNYLCLTLSPVISNHADSGYHALLYGSEYQTYGEGHMDRDALCAVCRTPRPNTIMIPGTNRCESGWTLEYSGYLMAGRDIHAAASEFVCVDSAMQGRDGSNDDRNGILFYYTIAQCGSLPCDPYVNNKVVTCAVCSQ